MVFFKRKPVDFPPPKELPEDLDVDVWFIQETGEWFTDYEEYLSRMDYYNTRKFVCEITGNSNFTYFEALQYERQEMAEVEKKFPEPVREPILRYVQFSTTPRIDQLVDEVYNKFKKDFFPGDFVIVKLLGSIGSDKARGYVREKARFNAITMPDGEVRKAYCSYRVMLLDDNEITVNESQLSRERNSFTKWHVKTFLKLTLTRSTRIGAPWIVKDKYASKYRIPTEYPENLLEFLNPEAAKHTRRRGNATNQKKLKIRDMSNANINVPDAFAQMKETPPLHTAEDRSVLQAWKDSWYDILKRCHVYFDFDNDDTSDLSVRNKVYQLFVFAGVTVLRDFDPEKVNFIISLRPFNSKEVYPEDDIYYHVPDRNIKVWHYEKVFRFFKSLSITMRKINQIERAKMFVDKNKFVDILPAPNVGDDSEETLAKREHLHSAGTTTVRKGTVEDLSLNFEITKLRPVFQKFSEAKCVSELLETWCFLNIYRKPLVIDSFTFDDFVTAMQWDDPVHKCELLEEIFCSVLKLILNENYRPGYGKGDGLLVTLPTTVEDEQEEDQEEDQEGEDHAEEEDGQSNGNIKAETVEDSEDKSEKEIPSAEPESEEEEDEEEETNHNAYSVLEYKNLSWQERLRRRAFKEGGWQVILIGVLSLVEHVPQNRKVINDFLEQIAPPEEIATPNSVTVNFFQRLSFELRVKALNIVCSLLVNGSVIRNYIDECLDESTSLRRVRLEHIREYRARLEEAKAAHNMIMVAMGDIEPQDSSASTPAPQGNEKKRRRGRATNYPPLEPTEQEIAFASANPDIMKLLKQRTDIMKKVEEAKALRKDHERKLNEIDVQRVRYIGRDRDFNRYWWFEANGLPTLKHVHNNEDDEEEDLEDDDDIENPIEDERFLMGRLWIQGPSNEDRTKFLQFSDDQLKQWNEIVETTEDDTVMNDTIKKEDDKDTVSPETTLSEMEKQNNYTDVPAGFARAAKHIFGLVFENGIVKDVNNAIIVDEYGATASKQYHPVERKILEEGPDCLLDSEEWRFIDSADDLDNLLKWLNPAGKREFQLRKELFLLQDNIRSSMISRQKVLGIGIKSAAEEELEQTLRDTVISETEESDVEDDDYDMSETPDFDSESEVSSPAPVGKPRTRRSAVATEEEQPTPKKKPRGASARIARREYKRRKMREHKKKRKIIEQVREQLGSIREEKNRKSVLQWVNSSAMEQLGHLHSEPPPKRGRPPSKKGRK